MQAFQALRSLFTAFLVLFGLLDNSILHVHDTSQEPVHDSAMRVHRMQCHGGGRKYVFPLIHVVGKGAHQNRPVFCGPLAFGLWGLWRLGGGLGDIGGDQVKVGPSGGDNVAGRHRHAQNMISVAEHVSWAVFSSQRNGREQAAGPETGAKQAADSGRFRGASADRRTALTSRCLRCGLLSPDNGGHTLDADVTRCTRADFGLHTTELI